MDELSKVEILVLKLLKKPMTCTEVGEMLWGGKRNRQSYARPAGAIIVRLRKAGLVSRVFPDGWSQRSPLWQAMNLTGRKKG